MQRLAIGKGKYAILNMAESERSRMETLEKIRNWLSKCPGWVSSWKIYFDTTENAPGTVGIYSLGEEIISRREDVLGNVEDLCRCRFQVYWRLPTEDRQANAKWLLEVQSWIRQQSALGKAPTFGNEPKKERIWAEKGKLFEENNVSAATYGMTIVAEFVKKY